MAKRKALIGWSLGLVLVVGLGWWGVKRMTSLPGEVVADLGREHLSREELAKVTYNSNPPTSGSHDPEWIRPGIYDTPQDKYKLIHSLEHGYIVVHYNCALPISNFQFSIFNQFSMIQLAKAHEDEGDADRDGTSSATQPLTEDPSGKKGPYIEGREFYPGSLFPYEKAAFESLECRQLKETLSGFKNKLRLPRTIVQPNPEIDKPVVLTAWDRVLKLDQWDEMEATRFARAFHNKGPEQTME